MMMAVVPMPNGTYVVESRKRPLDEPVDLIDFKRERSDMEDYPLEHGVNFLAPPPGQLILKVLIPGYAAGALIGKGGQIIVQLQKESGAIIKLSKAKDFYPGTQDRVVLIQGTAEGLMKVHGTIIEKVFDFPVPKDLTAIIGDRPKQVKIIVPNTTAGLVIGKAGATVKTIMEESGSKVQLSQKPEGANVQERVITIKGDKTQLTTASNIIIDKIKDDPQSASCPNISYSGVSGPVANANPTGSPYAAGSPAIVDASHPVVQAMLGHYVIPNQHHVLQAAVPTALPTLSAPNGEMTTLNTGLGGLTYGVNYSALGMVPNVHSNLHSGIATSVGIVPAGSLAGTVSPVPSATPLLSATPLPAETIPAAGIPAAQTISWPNNYLASLASAGYLTTGHPQLVGTHGITGSLSTMTQQLPPSATPMASTPATPALTTYAQQATVSLLSVEKSTDGQKETIDLSIPENLIGAILGKAGRTLVEYQDISGAKIQISKKGEYVVGTRNRRVTITGKPPSTQTAQFLITQRVAAAQTARAQQAKLM
ncbi:RNA-binding protein Nova-1-like isoform X1 [Clavelina lepadiformis]|uniref:RNA-binding protein Nova-1-like isoform X1 n=1 Tax=Clavelina lepadiformis TaxID=159417 RepID=UPI004040FD8F